MKKFIILFIAGLLLGGGALVVYHYFQNNSFIDPLSEKAKRIVEKPLEKYTFQRLKDTQFTPSAFTIKDSLKEAELYTSYEIEYIVDGKKVSGMLNVPSKSGVYPLIVQLRGFVPKEMYAIGEGTRRSGEYFASNGFITIAPDFLGYGHSDNPSQSGIEERLQTYTTVLTLLSSVEQLNEALKEKKLAMQIDTESVGIWGHSNGGHIALSVLAITGKEYPTVLWNPVTKSFPYSILYFTDEYDDQGKALRKVVAEFEEDYDIQLYSPLQYYSWIKAPIQLHQGGDDEAVPLRWSNQFVEIMKNLDEERELEYFVYPGDDHNFSKGGWSIVVQRNAEFFNRQFAQ